MGEYVKLDGQPVKLGTCEDLGYCTFQQYVDCLTSGRLQGHNVPSNEEPSAYIAGAYRFRFPFPDEDSVEPGAFDDIDKGHDIAVPKSLGLGFEEHLGLSHYLKPRYSNNGGFNVFYPCPASKEWAAAKLKTSVGPHPFETFDLLTIAQQRPLQGKLWTVVRCAYCGKAARLAKEEADKLVAYLRGGTGSIFQPGSREETFWFEVANRIEAGYAEDNALARLLGGAK